MFKILILIVSIAPAWGSENPHQDLDSIIAVAVKKNPEILRAKEHWKTLMAQVPAEATWNEPVIGFQRMNFQGGDAGNYWSVAQDIPFPGKLSKSAEMKRHEALIAYQEYRAQKLNVIAQVTRTYARICWLKDTSQILKKDSEILNAVSKVAEASVASGRARADEALSAQAAFIKVRNAAKERQAESLVQEEALNALLDQTPGNRWRLLPPQEPQRLNVGASQLDQLAQKISPDYMEALHLISHAQAMVTLGKMGFLPDFQFTATQESGRPVPAMEESAYGVNLAIPLWFWKENAVLKSAETHAREAVAASREARNEIFRQIHSELIEVNLHQELAQSDKQELIPLAKGAFKIAEKGYEAGRTSFSQLSQAVRALLDAQLKYPTEVELYQEHLANLERALGGPPNLKASAMSKEDMNP